MIEHEWTIPCRICTIDRFSNNASLIEVLEELRISPQTQTPEDRVPAVFDIVTLWSRTDEPVAGNARVSIIAPDGHSLFSAEYEVDLQNNQRTRHRGRIVGFPAKMSGKYVIRVELQDDDGEWTIVGKSPVCVTVDTGEAEELPESGNGRE